MTKKQKIPLNISEALLTPDESGSPYRESLILNTWDLLTNIEHSAPGSLIAIQLPYPTKLESLENEHQGYIKAYFLYGRPASDNTPTFRELKAYTRRLGDILRRATSDFNWPQYIKIHIAGMHVTSLQVYVDNAFKSALVNYFNVHLNDEYCRPLPSEDAGKEDGILHAHYWKIYEYTNQNVAVRVSDECLEDVKSFTARLSYESSLLWTSNSIDFFRYLECYLAKSLEKEHKRTRIALKLKDQ
jgi:hypothetical protein